MTLNLVKAGSYFAAGLTKSRMSEFAWLVHTLSQAAPSWAYFNFPWFQLMVQWNSQQFHGIPSNFTCVLRESMNAAAYGLRQSMNQPLVLFASSLVILHKTRLSQIIILCRFTTWLSYLLIFLISLYAFSSYGKYFVASFEGHTVNFIYEYMYPPYSNSYL